MKESLFGFEYSGEDLKPVYPLYYTTLVFQMVGAALSLWLAVLPSKLVQVWAGGALATFPGFLLGLAVQAYLRPGSIGENRVMVRRMGLIALVLSLSVFVLPLDEFGRRPAPASK